MDCLVDTNVILRAADLAHPSSQEARSAMRVLFQKGSRLCLAKQSLVEAWVVATRPRDVNGFGLSAQFAATQLLPGAKGLLHSAGDRRDLPPMANSGAAISSARKSGARREAGSRHAGPRDRNHRDVQRRRFSTVRGHPNPAAGSSLKGRAALPTKRDGRSEESARRPGPRKSRSLRRTKALELVTPYMTFRCPERLQAGYVPAAGHSPMA